MVDRLLDDLDPELLPELDEVCRLNQLTSLPVSRGRNTLEYSIEKYPEIAPSLEQDRQRRIDSMRLTSRLHEDEQREEKFRVGSVDKSSYLSTPAQKNRQLSNSVKAVQESPLLRPKQSTGDLIFQMDDDAGAHTPAREPHTPLMRPEADAGPLSPKVLATPDDGTFLGTPGSGPIPFNLPRPALSKGKQPVRESPAHGDTKSPWRLVESPAAKVDLGGILAEASTSKSPAVADGSTSRKESSTSAHFAPTKLSQKERKKLQQQHMQNTLSDELTSNMKPASPASPWQTPAKPKEPATLPVVERPKPTPAPNQTRASSRVSMTMRQTVAGTPPQHIQSQSKPQIQTQTQTQTPRKQIPQNQIQSTPPRPSPKTEQPHQFTTPVYAPTPAEVSHYTDTQRSLASILYEQQTEKDIIREAATAKHNLHDIQLEQEFQEWWAKETRRVQEEADAAAAEAEAAVAKPSRPGKSSRGGRGGRGAGRGKRVPLGEQQQSGEGSQSANVDAISANVNTAASTPAPNPGGQPKSQHGPPTGDKRNPPQRGRGSAHHPPSGRGKGPRGGQRSHPHPIQSRPQQQQPQPQPQSQPQRS